MQGVCKSDEPIPECVLREERGFCQHYATTMAMVLRGMGIPSRVVTGYLRGERVNEEWVVEQAAFHNWVEAWFPDYGWVRFDPTPRDEFGMTPTRLPEGPATPRGTEPSPLPTSPVETLEPVDPEETPGIEGAGSARPGPTDDPVSALLLGAGLVLLLSIGVAGLLFFRFRRLSEVDGGVAYRGIVSLASRLGYGPHPSQTEYEYAGSLSETLPDVRDDLYLVADARVEKAYGQRQIEGQRRGALRRAYARIRTALLRLSLRRR
ncbi:MAG: transglutaminase domain-containing protein, partial [Chloroflexota bacterium]|nr:transglutaminase domain-containing protein [Chloroflexota bacterium]